MNQRVKNVAGYWDRGVFRPIRKPKYLKRGGKKVTDKKQLKLYADKYDRERAGDFDDVFDREIRKNRNRAKADKILQSQLENAIRREMLGDSFQESAGQTLIQFVRSYGGIKRGKMHKGNLEFLSFKESKKRGLVSDTKGKTLDYMYQAATEAGFDLNSPDDLLDKLDDELNGKPFYATLGYKDYRSNPKRNSSTMKKKPLTKTQISQTAKNLIKAFPKLSASEIIKRFKNPSKLHVIEISPNNFAVFLGTNVLKKGFKTKIGAEIYIRQLHSRRHNPDELDAGELAQVAIETFDANEDGQVNYDDVEVFEENEGQNIIALTNSGEYGEVLAATGDDLILKVLDGENAGEIILEESENVQILDQEPTPEMAMNPAAIIRVKGQYKVMLPSGKFLKMNGREFVTKSKARALQVAAGVKLSRADELKWIRQIQAQSRRRFNPMHPLTAFANGAVGLISALQIKDRLAKKPRKTKRKNPAAQTKVKNPATNYNEIIKSLKVIQKSFRTKPFNKFVTVKNSLTRIKDRYYDKLRGTEKRTLQAAIKAAETKDFVGLSDEVWYLKHELEGLAKKEKVKNPQTFNRPAYEEFQGRKSTSRQQMPVSRHAPNNLDTLGRLIEIKLANGEIYNFEHRRKNPLVLTMSPRGRRLWIAGGKMARPNPQLEAHQVELVEPLEYVVYETSKPHIEGDNVERHYIHALGEETGELPMFGLDAEGFPIIYGGAYTIEDRGIVN